MFKSASDRQHFLRREGSHSTKGFANGRVDVLPPQAREAENLYADAKSQWDDVERLAHNLKCELANIQSDKKARYKQHKVDRITEIHSSLSDLADTRARLAELARGIGCEAYGWAFLCLAELRLSKEVFLKIDREVEVLMGRRRSEVKLPAGVVTRLRRARLAEAKSTDAVFGK